MKNTGFSDRHYVLDSIKHKMAVFNGKCKICTENQYDFSIARKNNRQNSIQHIILYVCYITRMLLRIEFYDDYRTCLRDFYADRKKRFPHFPMSVPGKNRENANV